MSKTTLSRSMALILASSVWLVSLAPINDAQRSARAAAKNPIVDIRVHADLKESYDLDRATPTETMKAHAELTVTQDYSRRMVWVGYQNNPGGFTSLPNTPGLNSGSFHYRSEDTLKGDKTGDKHVIDVAGSLVPTGTGDVQIGEGDSEVTGDVSSDMTKASCATSGNMNEPADHCGQTYVLDEIRIDQNDGTGDARSQLIFGYELHPATNLPEGYKGAGQFGEKQWYGSVTTGSNGKFEIDFDGKKVFDRPSEDQYTKTDHHEQHLHVTATVAPTGGTAENEPRVRDIPSSGAVLGALSSKFDVGERQRR